MASDILKAAISYAGLGLSVIPVNPSTKTPFVSWRNHQAERAELSTIRSWWQQFPEAGVGIVTGPVSDLLVVDIDTKDRQVLEGRHLPVTPIAATPRGEHRYFRYPRGSRIPSSVNLLPSVDMRADGGYVIAPPSQNGDRKKYQWVDGLSFDEVPLADCPEWLLALGQYSPVVQNGGGVHSNNITMYPKGDAPITGTILEALTSQPTFIEAAALILRIPSQAATKMGQPFPCVLPGHDEAKPSASLYCMPDGKVMYRDWHERSGQAWYSLAEVYASQCYGTVRKLTPPEQATWCIRLLEETGFVEPVEVDLPLLPASARRADKLVYEGFKRLLGCRWLHTPGAPTPFTREFAAAWTGLAPRHAVDAMKRLLADGYIQGAGECRPGARPLKLFLPGTDELVKQRAERLNKSE